MRLVRLIYASTSVNLVSAAEVEKIVEHAAAKNSRNSITGILLAGEQHFLQCIEGRREDVSVLYNKICQDSRHRRVELLDYGEVAERDFSLWSMQLVLTTRKNAASILRFAVRGEFEPYAMSGQSAHKLLLAFR